MYKLSLIEKLKDRQAVIGIFGLGYVGIPLALRYSEVGYKVLGFDIDQNKISQINQGKSFIQHISDDLISTAVHHGFSATADFNRVTEVDALILCVPTPLNKYREPDLSYVVNTIESILPNLKAGQVVSLESTTYPGTTEEELFTRIESKGLKVGENVFLIYSPEREDPGNPNFRTANIPKVCGGITPNCLEIGIHLYEQVVSKVVPVSSTRAAEMTKLLENIHRAVNIGLMNDMKKIAHKMNIDIFEVIHAAASKPFGFVPYYPGPGIGGHCIPIDPFYLTWKAREYGMHTRFIELAGEINGGMPKWVVERLTDALNEKGKSVNGAKILICGAAYKCNVDDMRESPSIFIMELLMQKKALVDYSDPHVPTLPALRHHALPAMKSVEITSATLANYDAVVIATAHEKFDYAIIQQHAKLIIDTRGVYPSQQFANVYPA